MSHGMYRIQIVKDTLMRGHAGYSPAPTSDVLEQPVAALEGGIAALHGGTYNLFAHTLPQFGITTRFADSRNLARFEALFDDKTKAVVIESISNPQGTVTDIAAIAEIAHLHGVPLIVDNTVAAPAWCRHAIPAPPSRRSTRF